MNKETNIKTKNFNELGGFLGWFIASIIYGLISSFGQISYNKIEFSPIITMMFIIQILLIMFCFIRKPQSLIIIKGLLLLSIVSSFLIPIYTGIFEPNFIGWLIVSLVWLSYFFMSKRVKVYFKTSKENIEKNRNEIFELNVNVATNTYNENEYPKQSINPKAIKNVSLSNLFNNKKATIIISVILLIIIVFISYSYYDFYISKQFVLRYTTSENEKQFENIIHTPKCVILKNTSSFEGVEEAKVVSDLLQDNIELCSLCKPKPSFVSAYNYYGYLIAELGRLNEKEEYDIDILEKSNIEREKKYEKIKNRLSNNRIIFKGPWGMPTSDSEWLEWNKQNKHSKEVEKEEEFYYEQALKNLGITENDISNAYSNNDRRKWLKENIPNIKAYLKTRNNIFKYLQKLNYIN